MPSEVLFSFNAWWDGMKSILFVVIVWLFSGTVSADIGLFLDGTQRLVKPGILQQEFNWVTFWQCPKIESCEQIAANHYNIGVVYTDARKMNAYMQKNSGNIVNFVRVHTSVNNGFKIIVDEATDVFGRYYLLLRLVKASGKASKNNITLAVMDEIIQAYDRNQLAQ
jgi:hypothetical protein